MHPDSRTLASLVKRRHACVRVVTMEEPHVMLIAHQAAAELGLRVHRWTVLSGMLDLQLQDKEIDEHMGTRDAQNVLDHLRRNAMRGLYVALDITPHLMDDPRAHRTFRDCIERMRNHDACLLLIDHEDNAPPIVRSLSEPMRLSLPDENELDEIIRDVAKVLRSSGGVSANIQKSTYTTMLRNLRGLTRSQARRVALDVMAEDLLLSEDDLAHAVASKRHILHVDGLLEFVDAPTEMDEIGGLTHLKRWLATRENALEDDAKHFGIEAPRGVLMLGVQGAGKSMCAKAIATAWKRPLLRLDPSVLYNKYIGESEHRLRNALEQAQAMAPIILWIDEIEKAFASAASHSVDGGLSQRMFGTLLTWMQEHEQPVFLVATANNIEALPPELMRKGRFDEIFFVDLPSASARKQIFQIHIAKRNHDTTKLDMDALADASEGFSGAEIEQAVIAALHQCFSDGRVPLTTSGLCDALRNSPPLSVTMAERVHELRQWAQGRCVMAE